ncbi:hypothetical protein PLESTB_000947700 [Pleodorina starrii]|uniref:Integrase catalytic domain-containing protein n=1 Tax=Pleodorina starrii TaxID=330485 RepID=A0A9W6BNP3_9CHLO|nr:hypothetical protein PLESTM_001151300 [Pleodorina starrii]GLC55135.1 hypothetical protein PLESTB_000947700 [Pleodorina starrii]GLC71112.1 hypothetical protein PLESTF_001075800 [Pleodorina starrii]
MSSVEPSHWKEVLKVDNSDDWFMKIRALLDCEDLDDVIKREFVMPAVGDAKYESVRKKVKRARAIMIMRLSASEHKSIIDGTTQAKDLWAGLEGWASQLNVAELNAVSRSFQSLLLGSEEKMHAYVTRALNLFEKLAKHRDFAVSERNGIVQIIRGLPDAVYATEKSVFLLSNYPKDFHELKEKLLALEAEKLASGRRTEPDTATALFAGRGGPKFGGCFNCGGNHFARDCPKGNASAASGSGRSSGGSRAATAGSDLRCDWCGKSGHVEEKCFRKKAGKPKSVEGKPEVVVLTLVAREEEFVPGETVAATRLREYQSLRPTSFVAAYSISERIRGLQGLVAREGEVLNPWWLDSGSKYHITGDQSVLHDFRPLAPGVSISIEVGNGNVLRAAGYGNVVPTLAPNVTIEGVFYVPGFKHNLVSVSVLADKGFRLEFEGEKVKVMRGDVRISATKCTNGLYKFMSSATIAPPAEPPAPALSAKVPASEVAGLWHRRFGHLGSANLKRLVQEGMVQGLDLSNVQLREFEGKICEPCVVGKHCRDPFPVSDSVTERPMQLVHMDVCGPLPESVEGHKYFLTMLDDYSGISVVHPLTWKSDVFSIVVESIELLEARSGQKLLTIRTDNGGEFTRLKKWCAGRGATHEKSAPYTPQQNGKAERLNRTLLDKLRAMLAESKVPKMWWHEALKTACHVRNRSPVSGKSKTPLELFTGKVPDVSRLRVFGCVAYVHVRKGLGDKLDPRARKGVFLGYEPNCKAYRVLLEEERIEVSRDVTFNEFVFPFVSEPTRAAIGANEQGWEVDLVVGARSADGGSGAVAAGGAAGAGPAGVGGVPVVPVPPGPAAGAPAANADEAGEGNGGVPVVPAAAAPAAGAPAADADEAGEGSDSEIDALDGDAVLPPPLVDSDDDDEDLVDGESDEEEDEDGAAASGSASGSGSGSGSGPASDGDSDPTPPRMSGRQRKPNTLLKDYVLSAPKVEEVFEPKSLAEAQARADWPQWKAAMDEEMKSLMENGTWDLEELPKGVKKIGLKWVFKVKRDAKDIERYKARLVAKGFTQREGVDFGEVFAPVGKYASLRALLAVVAERDLELHQLDIKTAFLNGVLEEEVYTEQPPGYQMGGANVACHLRRSLYGLHQAPRAWYVRLRSVLEQMGFKPSGAEPGLFVKVEKGEPVYVLVYVDDLLIACKSIEVVNQLKAQLDKVFEMRDLGESSFYLGFEIKRDRAARTLHVSQKRYVQEVLSKFAMEGANGRSTPLDANVRLSSEGELLDTSRFPYSELVGSLLYLSVCSRPDISFAVGALARHMAKPTTDHWSVAKGVLRYLAGTQDVGISFGGTGRLDVVGFCDSDLAGSEGRRSTSGFVFLLGGGAISWSSKLQPTIATSTAEAEYMAALGPFPFAAIAPRALRCWRALSPRRALSTLMCATTSRVSGLRGERFGWCSAPRWSSWRTSSRRHCRRRS